MNTATLMAPPTVSTLSASGLESYVRSVQALPLLTPEQEFELALQFRTQNNLDAARTLVLSHMRFVVALSRQYLGYGLPQSDLIQEGTVGLMKAVKRFDPTRGVRLVSFAVHWIKAEIHDYILRNWQLVKVATTKAQRKLFFNLRGLKRSLGQDRSLTQTQAKAIAEQLSVSPEEVLEMDMRLSGGDIALELPDDEAHEGRVAPLQSLKAENADPAITVAQSEFDAHQSQALQAALASLDDRSQAVLKARWLDEHGATLQALAVQFGVSAERIRQIEQAAMAKLRQALQTIER